jgi:3-isopropylmalate dehydrogenase
MEQCIRVLYEAEKNCNFRLEFEEIPCGGKYYQEYGEEYPSGTVEKCRHADAILKAPVGYVDLKTGKEVRLENGRLAGDGITIGFRKRFDLFAKVAHIKGYQNMPIKIVGGSFYDYSAKNIDFVVIRENIEGELSGLYDEEKDMMKKISKVTSYIVVTRPVTKRLHEFAFDLAKKRNGRPLDREKSVTCVDKSNAIRAHRFFRDIFEEVANNYQDIRAYHDYFDSFLYKFPRNPETYDVCVATNFEGDAIQDSAANLQGSLGVTSTANIGEKNIVCEPVHGSAPGSEGKDIVNPISMIKSGEMLLEWLGVRHKDDNLIQASRLIERSIEEVIKEGRVRTPDIGGNSKSSEVVKEIIKKMNLPLFEF